MEEGNARSLRLSRGCMGEIKARIGKQTREATLKITPAAGEGPRARGCAGGAPRTPSATGVAAGRAAGAVAWDCSAGTHTRHAMGCQFLLMLLAPLHPCSPLWKRGAAAGCCAVAGGLSRTYKNTPLRAPVLVLALQAPFGQGVQLLGGRGMQLLGGQGAGGRGLQRGVVRLP